MIDLEHTDIRWRMKSGMSFCVRCHVWYVGDWQEYCCEKCKTPEERVRFRTETKDEKMKIKTLEPDLRRALLPRQWTFRFANASPLWWFLLFASPTVGYCLAEAIIRLRAASGH